MSDLNLFWSKALGRNSESTHPYAINVNDDQSVFVTSNNTISKFNPNGSQAWKKTFEDNPDNALTLTQLHNEVLKTLQAASIDDSEISARRILEETTGVDVAQFPADGDQLVTHRAVARTDALTARRVNGEPLQYVIGSVNGEFFGGVQTTSHRYSIPFTVSTIDHQSHF